MIARSVKRRICMGFIVLAVMAVVVGLASYFARHPDQALHLEAWQHTLFWPLTLFRWLMYSLVYLSWRGLATRLSRGNATIAQDADRWRGVFLRLVIVYEVLFPFDMVSKVGGWV
jgi:hypothetical protein